MTLEESRREDRTGRCLLVFALIGCTLAAAIPLAAHTNLFGELKTEVILGCFVGIALSVVGTSVASLFARRRWGESRP